jgi:hypothetical protein
MSGVAFVIAQKISGSDSQSPGLPATPARRGAKNLDAVRVVPFMLVSRHLCVISDEKIVRFSHYTPSPFLTGAFVIARFRRLFPLPDGNKKKPDRV